MCIFAFNFNFLKNLYFTLLFFHSICFSFFFLLTFIIFFWSCLLLVINFLQVEHFRNLLKDSPNWWKLNVSKKKYSSLCCTQRAQVVTVLYTDWLFLRKHLFEMPESQNDFCCNIRSVYYWPFTALNIFSYWILLKIVQFFSLCFVWLLKRISMGNKVLRQKVRYLINGMKKN